jgi:hypothetical protein
MNPTPEPIPAIALEYAHPATTPRGLERTIALICLLVAAAACLIGWALIFWETETVIGSGTILCCAGAGLFACAVRLKHRPSMWLGLSHCAICAMFVGLVNVLRWGPQAATVPFLVVAGIYDVAVTIPMSLKCYRWLRTSAAAARDLPSVG